MDRVAWLRLTGRAVGAAALLSLLFRWRMEGWQSVVGCLLLPLACATGQV